MAQSIRGNGRPGVPVEPAMVEHLASAPHSSDWMTPALYVGMVVAIFMVIQALTFAIEREW